MFKRWILALAALGTLTLGVAHAQQPTLVFTAVPDEGETRHIESFTQYAKYFEAKLWRSRQISTREELSRRRNRLRP